MIQSASAPLNQICIADLIGRPDDAKHYLEGLAALKIKAYLTESNVRLYNYIRLDNSAVI